MSNKKREWVRSFEIFPATNLAPKSKILVFEVTSLIFPVGFPEAATKLVVRKKFSEFQALYKSMCEIHRTLYLKGKFPPPLPKSNNSYFKSSDSPESNEEKQVRCLQLLEFCAEHSQLCNNQIFTQFFSSDVETPSPNDETDRASNNVENIFSDKKAFNTIHKLSKEGQILDAAAMSSDLAPDPTPSLLPTPLIAASSEDLLQKPEQLSNTKVTDLNNSNSLCKAEQIEPKSESDEIPEYLSDAANLLSMAVQYEIEENYEESVSCYRNAIGTLLQSVQKDRCLKRQASVKRRISQYIGKAEALIQLDNASKNRKKSTLNSPGKSCARIPHLELFGNIRDLRMFKIQSILANKVLLVSENSNGDTKQVVIKALQKSSLVFKQRKTSMLPVNIPFMVKLLRYFETDELIYLVLEYVPNGPLFPIVKPYLNKLLPSQLGSRQMSASSMNRDRSPFSTSSVIKPSPSFVNFRRNSLQPDCASHRRRRSRSTSIEFGLPKTEEANVDEYFRSNSLEADYLRRSQSYETDETLSITEDFNFIYTRQNDVYCVDKEGIEKINRSDSLQDDVQQKGQTWTNQNNNMSDASKTISIKVSSSEQETTPIKNADVIATADSSQLVRDSQNLQSSLSAQLVEMKESKSAETILLEVEDIEKHIHLHLDGRSLTPSPCRSFRAMSGSPISPPSTSSLASSPPPMYAENELDSDEVVLSDLISTFDGIDLTSDDALLPLQLLRQWATQLCHVIFCLHSRGVIVQDLHPANLLLSNDLQLRLTYQCEWVSVDRPVNWDCIEMLYSAPEVADVGPLTPACDWWSVGAILYELLTGHRLVSVHPSGLLRHTPLHFPDTRRQTSRDQAVEEEMQSLISGFLHPVAAERLGAGTFGQNDIKGHPFFRSVNWSLT